MAARPATLETLALGRRSIAYGRYLFSGFKPDCYSIFPLGIPAA